MPSCVLLKASKTWQSQATKAVVPVELTASGPSLCAGHSRWRLSRTSRLGRQSTASCVYNDKELPSQSLGSGAVFVFGHRPHLFLWGMALLRCFWLCCHHSGSLTATSEVVGQSAQGRL